MTQRALPIDSAELLANTGWVRGLARSLLADADRADDVVQGTFAKALVNPPRPGVPLRPWLARVARNLSLQALRAENRRRRHETAAAVARPLALRDDDTVTRTDEFLAVVGAVRALDPIYRDVVVLRFLDELEMHAVAARLGVPVETARTRLKRALAMLRERLDRSHGGDGKAWALALLPVAGARQSPVGSWVTGGLFMATTKTVVVAATMGVLFGALVTAGVMSVGTGGGGEDPAPEIASAPRSGGLTPTPPTDRTRAESVRRDDAGGGRRPAGGGAASPRAESLDAWLDTVDVDLPATMTGSVTGHVRLKDGRPLAGAVVRATVQRSGGSYRRGVVPPPPPTLAESMRNAAVQVKWDAATRREAVTDASGAYVLTGLADLPCYVSGWAEGHEVRLDRGSSGSAKPGATVDFVASEIVTIPVTVLAADGSTPERATVRWSVPQKGGGSSSWWTAADPVVQVEPGTWSFYAETDADVRSQAVTATVAQGTPTEPIVLRLAGRNVLRGVVKFDPADRDWEYVTLHAVRRGAPPTEEEKRTSARPPDWRYHFDDVEPGEYEVSVSLDDTTPIATATTRVTGGPVEQNVAVPRMTAAQFLEVRVTGPDGSPVPGDEVSFSITRRTGGSVIGMGTRAVCRADGVFLVPLPGHDLEARLAARAGRGGGSAGGVAQEAPAPETGPATWLLKVSRRSPREKRASLSTPAKEVEFIHGTTTRLDVRLE